MVLDGIHVPVTTPFYPDGRLNLRKLEHNVDRYSRSPVAGMVLTSAVGEGTTLSDAETREAWSASIRAASAEKVMLAAILRDGVRAALELVESAAGLGFDAVLVGLPVLVQGRLLETMTYLRAIADRAALPVVLVSDRARPLAIEAVGELSAHPGIVGMVDGAGRVELILKASEGIRREVLTTTVFAAVTGRMMSRTSVAAASSGSYIGAESLAAGGTVVAAPAVGLRLKTRVREIGFQVLGCRTDTMLGDFRAGAVGAIPGMAACAPQACFEVLAGWKDGDAGLAEEKQARLEVATSRIEEEFGVPGIKYACDLNGYFGGRPRLPLLMCSGTERMEVEKLMREMQN